MIRIFFAAAAVLVPLLPSPAPAQSSAARRPVVVTSEELIVRHVRFADLDLRASADRNALVRRVQLAVSDACADAVGPSSLIYEKRACWKSSWADAQPQISNAVRRAQEMAASGTMLTGATVITVRIGK